MTQHMHFEGLTLTVESVERAIDFYKGKLGLTVEYNAAPDFVLLRVGGEKGGTIGLLSLHESQKEGVLTSAPAQKRAIHVEFSTDNLDALFEELKAKDTRENNLIKFSFASEAVRSSIHREIGRA